MANSSDGSTIGHCEIYLKDDAAKLGQILLIDKINVEKELASKW